MVYYVYMLWLREFWRFIVVGLLMATYFLLSSHREFYQLSVGVAYVCVAFGVLPLLRELFETIRAKRFGIDFLAFFAIGFGLVLGQYPAVLIIVLMTVGGASLEKFAQKRAQRSLKQLTDRIPQRVTLYEKKTVGRTLPLLSVQKGMYVVVRKGEVAAIDGDLVSDEGIFDESSLTGESVPVEKEKHGKVWSGTVNVGQMVVIKVTQEFSRSLYAEIIADVTNAQNGKTPFIRLADTYSLFFTGISLLIAAIAYAVTRDIVTVFAVFVVATPCPLILATPIALFGGVHRATVSHVVIKELQAIEKLSRVSTIVLDKTGTLTLGEPHLEKITIHGSMQENQAVTIAASIEQYSLHPLARAFVRYATTRKISLLSVISVEEKVGKGISGIVRGSRYTLQKIESGSGLLIGLFEGKKLVADFLFVETPKRDATKGLRELLRRGISLHILSGDKQKNVASLVSRTFPQLSIIAVGDASPKDKLSYITKLQKKGAIVAMVGDGINDAPSLARADVGIVFSKREHSAATDAGGVILLRSDLATIARLLSIAQRTMYIAKESIYVGIGASIVLMVIAALGYIPPFVGALLQEGLDLLVIMNALRAAK